MSPVSTLLDDTSEAAVLLRWPGLRVLGGPNRGVLWAVFLVATSGVVAWPVRLAFTFDPVQPLRMIAVSQWFAITLYAWMLLLLLLLASSTARPSVECAVLVGLFGLVFLGFFHFHEFMPGLQEEGAKSAAAIELTQASDHLPRSMIDTAGTAFSSLVLGDVTGISGPWAQAAILVLSCVLYPLFAFVLFTMWLRRGWLAAFGVVMYLEWSIVLARFQGLQEYYVGPLLLPMFIWVANRWAAAGWRSQPDQIVSLLLLTTTTMTHVLTAFLFVPVLLGIAAGGRHGHGRLPIGLCLPYAVVPVAWLAYVNQDQWRQGVFSVATVLSGGIHFAYLFLLSQASVGGTVPAWLSVTRLARMALLVVPGGIIIVVGFIRKLLRHRTRGCPLDVMFEAQAALLFVAGAITGLVSPGVGYLTRFLYYLPLYTVPAALVYLRRIANATVRLALLGAMAGILLVGVWPAFLADHATEAADMIMPQQARAYDFVERAVSADRTTRVFIPVQLLASSLYWVPLARKDTEGEAVQSVDRRTLFRQIGRFVERFDAARGNSLFVWSPAATWLYAHNYGVSQGDPFWTKLEQRIGRWPRVYDNGFYSVYLHAAPGAIAQ